MSKRDDRIAVVQTIQHAASLYKSNLIGKKFLYIFENKHVEVLFTVRHFKHLTGVESSLSANRFYREAINGRLRENQIWFSSRHPYSLCLRKLQHLSAIPQMAVNENFLLKEITTETQEFRLGSTNLDFTLCFNPSRNQAGEIDNECYHVESLRDEDCFQRAKNVYEVSHILSKKNDEKLYSKIEFIDERFTINDIPSNLSNMINV